MGTSDHFRYLGRKADCCDLPDHEFLLPLGLVGVGAADM
jgi:hypothetical protein